MQALQSRDMLTHLAQQINDDPDHKVNMSAVELLKVQALVEISETLRSIKHRGLPQ